MLLTQYPVPVEGENLGLVTKLVHAESGQFQASLAVIPLAKTDPQGMGSAFTYGRRCALSAMLGIITEEDDDGNAASYLKNNQRVPASKTINGKTDKTLPRNKPLSEMFIELGLEDLLPLYRKYLQAEYGFTKGNLSQNAYNEQKDLLINCKNEPLALRDFMRTLHEYK